MDRGKPDLGGLPAKGAKRRGLYAVSTDAGGFGICAAQAGPFAERRFFKTSSDVGKQAGGALT